MATQSGESMTGKIAIITGASRGLGRNTAVNLARHGVDLIFTYRSNQQEAESLIREAESMARKAAAFRFDTGDTTAFDKFVAEVRSTLRNWGRDRFDFLVNNAGHALRAAFTETTEAQFDGIVNVHFKGVFFLTQKLLPLMNDGGRIVNLSSGWRGSRFPAIPSTEPAKERSRSSPAIWPKNWVRAALPSMPLPPAPSRPISAAAQFATIPNSRSTSQR